MGVILFHCGCRIKYVHVDPKEVALYDDVDGALKMQLQRNVITIISICLI